MTVSAGDRAPDFSLPDQFGAPVRLAGMLEGGPVILVFFPLAFSGVCTGELAALQTELSEFAARGVQLAAVSVDSKAALRAWAEQEGYGFTLLSDFWPHGAVATAYGAFRQDRGYASRSTFVIGRDGVIRAAFSAPLGEARPIEAYRAALALVE